MLQQAYGVDLMDIAAGGHLDNTTTSWLAERSMALRETLSSTAASWLNTAKSFVQVIDTSSAIQALRNITAKKDQSWNTNGIFACNSIEQLQTSNPVQQRYLMAHTGLRTLFLNNEAEGFHGSYENYHGDSIGVAHYDYRRVTDGIMMEAPEETFEVNTFYEEMTDGDVELTLHQKVDMIRNWNLIDRCLDEHEMDPSSPAGNML